MGTSKSYSASIKGQPQWGNLSGAVTTSCDGSKASTSQLGNILSRYTSVIGGSNRAGRGNSRIAGRGGIRTAKNFGAIVGAFVGNGGDLIRALESVGLKDLEGRSLSEVIDAILEYCTGPASTLDDVAAKAATQKLLEELLNNAETISELESNLKETLRNETLEEVIERYFGYCIYEHLSIMFYEKLIVDKGKGQCENLFRQIRDYILEKLKNINKTNPLKDIDWKSADADRLIKNIQEDVLKVFEGYES